MTENNTSSPKPQNPKSVSASQLAGHWRQFKDDVWDQPTIRSVGATLLTVLIGVIVELTRRYSPATSEDGGGTIDPSTGNLVILGVGLATIVAAYEPHVSRLVGNWIWSGGRQTFLTLPRWLQFLWVGVRSLIWAPFKVLSVAWSFVDYLLARPIAMLAGAKAVGWKWRYTWLLLLMAGLILVAWMATDGRLPAKMGMTAVGTALILILAVVRRWTWFEADRDTYLIERGGTREDAIRPSEQQQREKTVSNAVLAFFALGWLAVGMVLGWPSLQRLPVWLFWITLGLAASTAFVFLVTLVSAIVPSKRGKAPVARRSALRIGFKEDLRDEALFSIVFLLALAPLALDLVYQLSDRTAFVPNGDKIIPHDDTWARLVMWFGYFGAELAKAVPFVDWSEVFRAVNDAAVRPAEGADSPLGAQTVFVMRAGLDLLLLATVVQAVGLVSRLREQNTAFANNQLPILEPFSEARELERAYQGIKEELNIPLAQQHAIAIFPNYDAKRLRELISGVDITPTELRATRWMVRRAAVVLLAAKHPGGDTDAFLFDRAQKKDDPDLCEWILDVASGLAPERTLEERMEDRKKLAELLQSRIEPAPVRAAAARRLGRIGDESNVALLLDRLRDPKENFGVRADSAVAASKLVRTEERRAEVEQQTRKLAAELTQAYPELLAQAAAQEGKTIDNMKLTGEPLLPFMTTAHALARSSRALGAEGIAKLFPEDLRLHVVHAASIQIDPLTPQEAVGLNEIGENLNQLVRIKADRFDMGFDFWAKVKEEGQSEDDLKRAGWRIDQDPLTRVSIERDFAIGRFPVTNREYLGYCEAMGLKGIGEEVGALDRGQSKRPDGAKSPKQRDYPVVQVSWYDGNAYAGWLERITGDRYRLPTEAEWEFACRAGTSEAYWWGNDKFPVGEEGDIRNISPVNRKGAGPNPWGLWSLYGHVYEWCADPWHKNLKGRPSTGKIWLENCDPNRRVVRGGSFNWPGPGEGPNGEDDLHARRNELRSSYRNQQVPSHIQTNYGFRLARSLNEYANQEDQKGGE